VAHESRIFDEKKLFDASISEVRRPPMLSDQAICARSKKSRIGAGVEESVNAIGKQSQ
jgi:hypothetical protein